DLLVRHDGIPSLKERRARGWVRETPVDSMISGARNPAHRKPSLQKTRQAGYPARPDGEANATIPLVRRVPKSFGTNRGTAARHVPGLAKTRCFLPLISRFRRRSKDIRRSGHRL